MVGNEQDGESLTAFNCSGQESKQLTITPQAIT